MAGIAYPSYMQYIYVSNRSEAKIALTEIANKQEQYFLDHNQYANDLTQLGYASASIESSSGYYKISVSNVNRAVDFALLATAINRQANDGKCAQFSLNYLQQKGASNDDCWQ
ncbi:type IV pilin protein [Motilimonas sp. KMU-193]|uniref:type IV pilin protein n=1 Tax=Motilimonas sp. KMU-193 TaxID=3388668 RepID=UPI00396AF0FF